MENKKPFFSIIIPTYNRPGQLASCLEACSRLDYPRTRFEIIVVDDSGKTSTDITTPFRDRVDVIMISQPHSGPAEARNKGASRANGEFLVFTDDDCYPASDWLQILASRFLLIPDQAIGGRTFNVLSNNLYSVTSQMILDYLCRYYNADPDRARFLTSSNLALPAYCFRAIGGFDKSFRMAAGEDRELTDRLLHKGCRITYAPEVLVYHNHPLTLYSFWQQHFNYGRGALLFHQLSARRRKRPIRLEPLFSYMTLMLYPFSQKRKKRAFLLAMLGMAAQMAVASGFAAMKIKPFFRQNLQKIRYFNKFYRIYSKNKANNKTNLAFKIIRKKVARTLRPIGFSPFVLQIEITTKCNLDCSMCDRNNRLKEYEINQSMTFEKYRKIVKKHSNLLAIYLSGLGEPILNSDLLDIIEFTSNNGIFPYMITNGLLLTGDLYKKLVKSGLGWLTISLDSIRNYSDIRKKGNFDTLNDNINTFIELRKQGYSVPISFTITVTNQNISEIEEIINYGINKGIDKVFIQDVRSNSKIKETDKITELDYMVLKERIKSYRNIIGIELMFNRFNRTNRCTRPWEVAFYSVKGDYLFCCYTDKRISFGNILYEDFPKCNQNTRKLLMDLKRRKIPEMCRGCTLVDIPCHLS